MVSNCEECLHALQILGISPPVSDEEIKSSFRDYVRVWHPDRFVHDPKLRLRAEQELKKINAAYHHLNGHLTDKVAPEEDVEEGYPEAGHSWQMGGRVAHARLEGPVIWRCIKVFLRTAWRVFKVAAVLALGAVFVVGIIAQLATYWSNELDRKKGDIHAEIKSWQTDLYLSGLLGIPLAAVRGLILLSSALVMVVAFVGEAIWRSVLTHQILAISLLAAASLCCVVWACYREYQSEFVLTVSSSVPGTASWMLGLIVLLGSVAGVHYFVPSFRAAAPGTVASEQPKQQLPTPATPPAPVEPKELWRPARAVKNLPVWDFRDTFPNKQVTDPSTLQELRNAIEASIAEHLDEFVFYGPVSGNFLGEVPASHQQLYTAILSWIVAGRSHAEGDRVLAVVLGGDGPRVFELQGGGPSIGALRLPGAKQDLILSTPEWSGQGETMLGLVIFALSDGQARKVAGISTVYVDNCAAEPPKPAVVADRIFADIDTIGDFSFNNKEHWSVPCAPGKPFTLISKGMDSAEDVLLHLDTPDDVPQ